MRLIVLAAALLASEASAQAGVLKVIEQDPIIGVRAVSEWHADSAVKRSCPEFVLRSPGPQDIGHDGPAFRTWCGVDTTYALGDADGSRWMTVIYSRRSEYAPDPTLRNRRGATRDTVRLISAV